VTRVRRAVTLPILVKDFVIDRYQLLEARAAGADCILLIARILTTEQLGGLLAAASDLKLDCLVECHDEEDLQKATAVGAKLVGVNSRDLSRLTVSLDTTRRMLAKIPRSAVRVAESGIQKASDIQELAAAGADAFLVGTALLQTADPGAKLRELVGDRSEDSMSHRRGSRS